MSSPANAQHEPTMEEILASIRKIISEDQPEAVKPAPQPALRAVPSEPAPVAAAELDVLELTEEIPDETEASVQDQQEEPQEEALLANDIAFETIEVPPKAEEAHVQEDDSDDLISDSTRSAVGRAFANIDAPRTEISAPPGGTLDAIFVHAIQSAFQPTLQQWVDGHDNEIMDRMKPLIRAWMDEHLPPLIEAAVAREIGRAATSRPRKR